MTMIKIEHIEVGSGGAASIEFTSIPAAYTDLMILVSSRAGSGGAGGLDNIMTFNSSTSGYSTRSLQGTGSSVVSQTGPTNGMKIGAWVNSTTANTFGNAAIYIPNYTGSQNKSVNVNLVAENNNTTGYQFLVAGLWSNSSAITSIKFDPESSYSLQQYSSFTLYGITAGSDGTTTVS